MTTPDQTNKRRVDESCERSMETRSRRRSKYAALSTRFPRVWSKEPMQRFSAGRSESRQSQDTSAGRVLARSDLGYARVVAPRAITGSNPFQGYTPLCVSLDNLAPKKAS